MTYLFVVIISLNLLRNIPMLLLLWVLIIIISDPSTALVEAFIKTDGAFRKEFRSQSKTRTILQKDSHPGCTAIASLIVKDRLFVANAGDCRAILCRAGYPYALSRVRILH